MGWFEEQIEQRKKYSEEAFEEAFYKLSDSITGKNVSKAMEVDAIKTRDAITAVLKYYGIKKIKEVPAEITDVNEQLDYLIRPEGMMTRVVKLTEGWYKDAYTAMLGTLKADGSLIALIPGKLGGFTFYDPTTGKRRRVNRKSAALIEEEAISFYRQFPLKKLRIVDLGIFALKNLKPSDFIFFGILSLIGTGLGLLIVDINKVLMSDVLETGKLGVLIACSIFLISTQLSQMIFGVANALFSQRFNKKMDLAIESATMMRVLSLPPDFFKKYSSGDLSSRIGYIGSLCNLITSAIFDTGFQAIFSLAYITQIGKFAPLLVAPSIVVIVISFVFSIASSLLTMKISKQKMELGTKERGLSYAIITGVKKIKLAGVEKLVFSKWANLHAESARLEYNPPFFIKYNVVISSAIGLIGTIVMYYFALSSGVSVADYYAFNSAYGMLSGAFMAIAEIALSFARIKPIMEMAKPLLDAEPEVSEGKQILTRVSGNIAVENLSFRYDEKMPNVIDGLSFTIKPGQYVAIVGKTGCGKSTLMRLLLGFEKPDKGTIYYDSKDIADLELHSLRRKIGVVMQNGSLFAGDIYSNIVISAPELNLDEAWEAAEQAGIAEDIRKMPMGMHTLISEGAGAISGGQKQRIMIARAIAPKPKILMLDEATSALDNITQKIVSDSLDKLNCTRIVIAHRLSTIKQCDRIIVLDKGHIIEDGTYDELIAQNGYFAELVERQQVGSTKAPSPQ
ncbi:MAG: ATP-binding cassette domain-containing protein [Clostridia bacterium]|nr:ATP-binding cassette domain-containing protein [Clostridia bacterium]